jgi:hypothetical protein
MYFDVEGEWTSHLVFWAQGFVYFNLWQASRISEIRAEQSSLSTRDSQFDIDRVLDRGEAWNKMHLSTLE